MSLERQVGRVSQVGEKFPAKILFSILLTMGSDWYVLRIREERVKQRCHQFAFQKEYSGCSMQTWKGLSEAVVHAGSVAAPVVQGR